MASFVEQATLLLNDKATDDIKRVNAALKQLFATSQRMKNMRINLGITPTAISRANKLAAALTKLKAATTGLKGLKITPTISTASVTKMRQLATAMKQLHAQSKAIGPGGFHLPMPTVDLSKLADIRKATAVLIRYAAAMKQARNASGGRLPTVPNPNPRVPGGGGRNPTGFFGRLSGGGLLGSFAAFTALSSAANLAAAALRALATQAAARDRTNLLVGAGATPAQQAIINAAVAPADAGPIRFSDNQRRQMIQSLLGDVQVPEGTTGVAAEKFRADAAVKIAAALETQVLPRQFALNPDKDINEVQEGLRMLVKAMNLGSTEITDASGNLSKEGLRVLNAAQIAMAADPELTPELIKTTMAGLKTAAFSMSQDDLIRVLLNAGARGSRAGNEAFRAQQMLLGQVDNKTLNNALAAAGLLENVERNKQGNVITSSGTVVDKELFEGDFNAWLGKHVIAPMNKALGEGATNAQQVAFLNQMFAGAPAAGKQGLVDFILGDAQMKSSMEQAKAVFAQNPSAVLEASWTAQLANAGQALTDSAGNLGEAAMKLIGAAEVLSGVADHLRGEDANGNKTTDVPPALATSVEDLVNPLDPISLLKKIGRDLGLLTVGSAAAADMSGSAAAPIVAEVEKRQLAEAKTRVNEIISSLAGLEASQQTLRDQGKMASPWVGGQIVSLENELAALQASINKLSASVSRQAGSNILKENAKIAADAAAKKRVFDASIPEDPRLSANRTLRNIQSKANKDEVVAFQKRMGLKEDGIVGRETRRAMREATQKFIKAGATIEDIKKIQTDAAIKVDGIVGPQTEQAIALQGFGAALDGILKDGGGVNIINWPAAMLQRLAGVPAAGTGGANKVLTDIQDKRDDRFTAPPENFVATAAAAATAAMQRIQDTRDDRKVEATAGTASVVKQIVSDLGNTSIPGRPNVFGEPTTQKPLPVSITNLIRPDVVTPGITTRPGIGAEGGSNLSAEIASLGVQWFKDNVFKTLTDAGAGKMEPDTSAIVPAVSAGVKAAIESLGTIKGRDNVFGEPEAKAADEPGFDFSSLFSGVASTFESAFGTGAGQIAEAGTQAGASIESGLASGGAGAGSTIAADMIGAAGQVGAIIANAVRSAAAGISVNVNATGGGGGRSLDTGHTNGARPGGPI